MVSVFNIMPSALFFVPGPAANDDTIQNKVNVIVKKELDSAFEEISQKISQI